MPTKRTKIFAKSTLWSFKKNIPKKFSNHIKQSVPLYAETQEIVCGLSDFFLKEKSICYDLGSSTGTLLNKLSLRHTNKKINFFGVEVVKEMITQAKKENPFSKNVRYLNKNLNKIKFKNSDLVISCFTIQFIHPKHRQELINKIYKSLNWGGAFIFFEKIRGSDARFQDIFNQSYIDFKFSNKFSEKEILNKSRSLKGVLEPFSEKGNLGLLKRAGFEDIAGVYQWFCFKGWLCIK